MNARNKKYYLMLKRLKYADEIDNTKELISYSETFNISKANYDNELYFDVGIIKSAKKYIEKELQWYLSQKCSILNSPVSEIKIWNEVCSKDMFKNVNSNYGWCVFAAKNFSQYDFCIDELKKNHQSRKAQMIYTRPSIVIDYNFNGMSDYICTNNVHCFIRKNKLIYIVNQRSCDAIYGFLNDWAWHRFVAQKMLIELNLDFGKIIYNIDSLHIYDRHYDILQKIGKEVNNECKC